MTDEVLNVAKSGLIPPYRIVVDDGGSADYDGPKGRGSMTHITCAVGVRELQYDAIITRLPRGENGSFLKATSSEMTSEKAGSFIRSLEELDARIAVVGMAARSETNRDVADEMFQALSRWRSFHHKRHKIKKPHLMKMRCDYEAILNCYGELSRMQLVEQKEKREIERRVLIKDKAWSVLPGDLDAKIGFLRIQIDQESLPEDFKADCALYLQQALAMKSVIVEDVEWRSRQQEPLVLAADILAGVVHRHFSRGDVPEAWSAFEHAVHVGAASYQDGMKISIPAPPPDEERGDHTPDTNPDTQPPKS